MLDFYLLPDEQAAHASGSPLRYAGNVQEEELELAQQAGLLDSKAEFVDECRWDSKQVQSKLALLVSCPFHTRTTLYNILQQAAATDAGLLAVPAA